MFLLHLDGWDQAVPRLPVPNEACFAMPDVSIGAP